MSQITREAPPTPDFYAYPWHPLVAASNTPPFVRVEWADGTTLRLHDRWLRENAVDRGGIDLATREGLTDPAHVPAGFGVEDATIDDQGALVITFAPEGTVAPYHPGWLRHIADRRHEPDSYIPDSTAWEAADFGDAPPDHDGARVLDDPAVLTGWVNDLLRYGIARLRDAPIESDFLLELSNRIGPVRDTNFGPIWDVKADVEMLGNDATNSTANTTLRLPPHTDLPTRETPPGFQFLHCLANETAGGNSTMADGAAVVAHLREEHPEHYEALTTLRWIFFNRGPNIDHRWSGPFIDLGVHGSPLTLRAFHPLRAFPDMDDEDVPRAYAALACFSETAASARFQLSYPFAPGDIVGFDNRRILHGREAFSAGGARHLRGTYLDQDELRSFARVANRRLEYNNQSQTIGDNHA